MSVTDMPLSHQNDKIMKKKSKKARKEIYINAAKIFESGENGCIGICGVLTRLGLYGYSPKDALFTSAKGGMCPEAHLITLKEDNWYEDFKGDNKLRSIAMLLAAELAT